MNIEVEMPEMGENAGDEGIIAEWHVEEGDYVEKRDPLVEVTAGGATLEVPSPAAGFVVDRMMDEGDTVRIGDVLAIIEVDSGEDAEEEEET